MTCFFAGLAVLSLGWILPLVLGIRRLRRKTGGAILTGLSSLWGIAAVSLAAAAFLPDLLKSRRPDTEDFDPSACQVQMGKIILPHKSESQLVLYRPSQGRRWRFSTHDGVVLAPLGQYQLCQYSTTCEDAEKTKWTASCDLSYRKAKGLSVAVDAPCELEVGPPFKAQVTVEEPAPTVHLNLKVTGRGGDNFTIRRADETEEPPGFEVRSASGDPIQQGQLAFG